MHYFSTKKKEELIFHSIFLFILSLYYLIPYFLVGQLIVEYHDILEKEIVSNHIIGKLYRGDTESIKLFLAGEIKWYFIKRILQPLMLLYAFFETFRLIKYAVGIDVTNADGKDVPYKFWFKVENLKLLPGSYNVNVSSKKISFFKNTKVDVQYFIALEPESVYDE